MGEEAVGGELVDSLGAKPRQHYSAMGTIKDLES